MRLRVQSVYPLPPLKAWFLVPKYLGNDSNVYGLKQALQSTLAPLARVQANALLLELDEFELLDETGLEVLQDGSLVV